MVPRMPGRFTFKPGGQGGQHEIEAEAIEVYRNANGTS